MKRRTFSYSSGLGPRRRKHREDDQLDAVPLETKRKVARVEDVCSSSYEICQGSREVVPLSLGDTNESGTEDTLLENLYIGKENEGELSDTCLGSESTFHPESSSFEDKENKENTDGGRPSSSKISAAETGESSSKTSRCDRKLPPDCLLTPPSSSSHSHELSLLLPEPLYDSCRETPLPPGLGWADSNEVWDIMNRKDKLWSTLRDPNMFSKHASLEPKMRSILLDWLTEVCEVYKLHRETYYLAQDFIDRFLSAQKNVPKQQLQLIGITCLFVAAKVEEVYPPKISELAYVTDGACKESEIIEKELIILKALDWDLAPVTVNTWLTVFLQLYGQDEFDARDNRDDSEDEKDIETCPAEENLTVVSQRSEIQTQTRVSWRRRGRRRSFLPNAPLVILRPPRGSTFVFPQFPGIALARATLLSDFATLDAGALRFPYSVIAAATLYHVWSKEVALSVSGFRFVDIKPCVDWMSVFSVTLKESGMMAQLASKLKVVWARLGLNTASGDVCTRGSALLRTVPRLVVDDSHNIQTHLVDLDLLEKAQERLKRMSSEQVMTPPLVLTLSTSSSPTSSQDTVASSPAKSSALLTPPASSVKSFSASSSLGNVNVTPNTMPGSYGSTDFCVG